MLVMTVVKVAVVVVMAPVVLAMTPIVFAIVTHAIIHVTRTPTGHH